MTIIRRQVEEIGAHFESEYQRLGTGKDQRRRFESELAAIPLLVKSHLATPRNRPQMDAATEKRLHRIRQLIGIDPPDKTSR